VLVFWRRTRIKNADQRRKELRELLMKQAETTRPSEGSKTALAYCQSCITEYEEWFDWNEIRWVGWQQVVIIGSVVATLAGVVSLPAEWLKWIPDAQSLSWLRGIPAAVTTIAAGYLGSFTYREDAVRHELTAQALWNEMAKYIGHAEPYNKLDDAEDTGNFLKTICLLVETESRSWSALVTNIKVGAQPNNHSATAS
jgi:hypothetical protein